MEKNDNTTYTLHCSKKQLELIQLGLQKLSPIDIDPGDEAVILSMQFTIDTLEPNP